MKIKRSVADAIGAGLVVSLVVLTMIWVAHIRTPSAKAFRKAAYYEYQAIPLPFNRYTSDGVPLVSYKEYDGLLHPVAIAQRMLKYRGAGFSGREEDRQTFKRILIAVLGSQRLNGLDGSLEYSFDFRAGTYRHEFKAGWGSAMAQGVMLSVLARGYLDYPDLRLDIRRYGARLMRPLTNGALVYDISIGDEPLRFYEEYPVPGKPPLTLNGFIFTLIGLHEFHIVTGSALAAKLFRDGIETLVNILPFYNTKPLSTYDLSHLMYEGVRPNISPKYHGVHIRQLDYLYNVTGEPLLACVRDAMRENQAAVERKYGGHYSEWSLQDYKTLRWETPLAWGWPCADDFEQARDVYAAIPAVD